MGGMEVVGVLMACSPATPATPRLRCAASENDIAIMIVFFCDILDYDLGRQFLHGTMITTDLLFIEIDRHIR